MENSWYSLEVSLGWVLLTLVLAAVLAYFLYAQKQVPWSRNQNLILGFFRMMSVFLIALLLLNPLLKLSVNHTEMPKVILAIDNSRSMTMRGAVGQDADLSAWVGGAFQMLSEQYDATLIGMDGSELDTIRFDGQVTNLSGMLQNIAANYEGENVAAVVLVSDGIVNSGLLPQYGQYTFPIYGIGVGDTTMPKDLSINYVKNNKVAYQGNQFPVSVQLRQNGFDGQTVRLEVREGSTLKAEKNVRLESPLTSINFNLKADEAGLKRLKVLVSRLSGESSTQNNQQDAYINVVEGKERILIMAPAPHPDISAIRRVLDEAANYETVLYIPGISESDLAGEFDVLIEHQAFAYSRYPKVKAGGKWYIIGSRSTLGLRRNISFLRISQRGGQTDNVVPIYKPEFSLFTLNAEELEHLKQYPPLNVPFGQYTLSGPVEVLLSQGVGSVDTDRPLMMYYDDGTDKQAITVGTGFWQWRLQEFGSHGEAPLFKELILKTIQYLSIKADKKRFNVRPRQQTFTENDRIYIDTEVYNNVYERVYGNTIDLNLINEEGEVTNYQLIDSELSNYFNLGRLKAGVYRYKAGTTVGNKQITEEGEFVVRSIQLEALNLQADHDLLRAVSRNTDGKFFKWEERENLKQTLLNAHFPGVIHTESDLMPLINSLWLIAFIMLLLSVEWFLRKYWGAY
ncbi:hypothetical protein [Marinoscillum sp. MHG1-6]|uniref:hypothetical protein n=1 Tax=Marinoscillum sp. MHG1-6 TaxID=2959627 RepID=UPI0021581BBD|nr:hypothetical protein [Marinoscillum sp. MHG1-6]